MYVLDGQTDGWMVGQTDGRMDGVVHCVIMLSAALTESKLVG
jgi:hypothetical protein